MAMIFWSASRPASGEAAVADPVAAAIAAAESVLAAGGEAQLARWADGARDLAGAAVASLADDAVAAGEEGDDGARTRGLDLAAALAAAVGSEGATLVAREARAWDGAALALRREARALEAAADAARRDGRADEAVELLTQAERLYARAPDTHARAVVWGSLGVAHWARGDWASVQAAYDSALALRRLVDDRILEGRTLNGLGSVQFQQRRWAEALAWYEQAAQVRRSTGDLSGLGTTLTYAANCRLQLGETARARDLYAEALPVLELTGRPVQVVESLNGIAGLDVSLGRYREASAGYERALAICATDPECAWGPLLRVNLGGALRLQGRLQEATQALRAARDTLGEDADVALRVRLHTDLGLTALALGDRDTARDELLGAVRLAREAHDRALEGDGLVNLGWLYLQLDAAPQGLQAAEQALALAREAGDAERTRDALALQGDARHRLGDHDGAATAFRTLLEEAPDGPLAADAEVGLANALGRLGRLAEARAGYRRAGALLAQSGRDDQAWVPLLGLGDTFERDDPDSAAWHYDRALARLEGSEQAAGSGALRTGAMFAQRGRAYEEVARYYAARHRAEPRAEWDARAFATAERAKARGLRDLIGRAGGVADARGAGEGTGEPVTLERLQRALPSRGLLLEYAVGDSATLLWAVDRSEVLLAELPPRAQLRLRVQQLRDAVARPGAGDETLRREARALYRALLEPVEALLARARDVVIVPDDVLFELPFELLLRRDPAPDEPWKDLAFLARDVTPAYAPSATVHLELAARDPGRDRFDLQLLALGAPDYARLAPWGGEGAPPLAPLPQAGAEVLAIAATVEPARREVMTGADASETALRRALGSHRPRVVHLATHGLIDPAEPARSCVALAAGPGGDDGYLGTLEILALPLADPLVVLSACESARGRLERGEGAIGLTRALLGAGARGTVASLWAVADASTARLMEEFYRGMLGRREGAAAALGAARRALLADPRWSHPFHWAPFVLTGPARAPW